VTILDADLPNLEQSATKRRCRCGVESDWTPEDKLPGGWSVSRVPVRRQVQTGSTERSIKINSSTATVFDCPTCATRLREEARKRRARR